MLRSAREQSRLNLQPDLGAASTSRNDESLPQLPCYYSLGIQHSSSDPPRSPAPSPMAGGMLPKTCLSLAQLTTFRLWFPALLTPAPESPAATRAGQTGGC